MEGIRPFRSVFSADFLGRFPGPISWANFLGRFPRPFLDHFWAASPNPFRATPKANSFDMLSGMLQAQPPSSFLST